MDSLGALLFEGVGVGRQLEYFRYIVLFYVDIVGVRNFCYTNESAYRQKKPYSLS